MCIHPVKIGTSRVIPLLELTAYLTNAMCKLFSCRLRRGARRGVAAGLPAPQAGFPHPAGGLAALLHLLLQSLADRVNKSKTHDAPGNHMLYLCNFCTLSAELL